MDKQQKQLIGILEEKANEIQLQRDNAQDLLDIAIHKSKQPNVFTIKNHVFAFALAGFIGLGGVYAQLEKGIQYGSIIGSGTGLFIGLLSNAMDDGRQKREKDNLVERRRLELDSLESELAINVQRYREEEEIGWLMFALGISKDQFFVLGEWMSDPRRSMKDAILESIDIITVSYLSKDFDIGQSDHILREREYRKIRNRLFSEEVQVKREKFMLRIAEKHNLLQERERSSSLNQSERRIATGSVVGATASGLAAGAAVAGIGSGIASTFGASKDTANLVGTLGGAAAVVGVGLLAASAITEMMRKLEEDRQHREIQNFKHSFTVCSKVLEIISANISADDQTKIKAARLVLQMLNSFKNKELETQDKPLKDYVNALRACIKSFIGDPQDNDYLGQIFKFLDSLFE